MDKFIHFTSLFIFTKCLNYYNLHLFKKLNVPVFPALQDSPTYEGKHANECSIFIFLSGTLIYNAH